MTAAAPARISEGPRARAWLSANCRHTMAVEGIEPGSPFDMYEEQAAFVDEALERDPATGRRMWKAAIYKVPRKCGKTTMAAGLALYFASPDAVGRVEVHAERGLVLHPEPRPHVILAAGSKEQAGETYDQTTAFIDDPSHGSQTLSALYTAQKTMIACPRNGGRIKRVAGDGKLNHGLNPYVVVADEIHAWHTPRQLENWKALTTAQGARVDPFILGITTEADDPNSLLEQIIARVRDAASTEVEERNHVELDDGRVVPCLRIYRNPVARVLVYEYGVPAGTPFARTDIWKAANPAPWRTEERIAEDLQDPLTDEATKRRLYGNELVDTPVQWLPPGRWAELAEPGREPAPGALVVAGGDASRTRDTTAVALCWRDGERYGLMAHVWSLNAKQQAHVWQEGNAIDLKAVRRYVAGSVLAGPEYAGTTDDLVSLYRLMGFGYDPRFMHDMADDLDEAGITVVPLEPSSTSYLDALQDFYDAVLEGKVYHVGDEVLAAHVRAAAGKKLERGWKVSKLDAAKPIDALVACVIAYAHRSLLDVAESGLVVLGPDGEPLEASDAAVLEAFGWVGDPADAEEGMVQRGCTSCLRFPVVEEGETTCPFCGYDTLAEVAL